VTRKKETSASRGIEDANDIAHARREWRIERIGYALMTVVLLGAFGGFLGSGPASHAAAESPDGALRVEYARFERREAPSVLRIRMRPPGRDAGGVGFWIEREWAAGVQIESMDPEPQRRLLTADRMTYEFAAATGEDLLVVVRYKADEAGWKRARVGLAGGPEIQLTQLVYP
jgi:hypothetical protein